MRLVPLFAAAALLAPASALAHDMGRDGPPPPLAGAPWAEPGMEGPGPMRGPPPRALACPGAFPGGMAGMPRMGPPPMRMAGGPCGPCVIRRPVRLHDGWLSWPGKSYF